MSEAIYLDTNVYLDYFMARRGSDIAYRILKRSLDCEFSLVISDWVLSELGRYAGSAETKMWFAALKGRNKIITVSHSEEDVEAAKKISNHYHDPLHAILAKKAGAKKLVTRNMQDYLKCTHLVNPVFPENI